MKQLLKIEAIIGIVVIASLLLLFTFGVMSLPSLIANTVLAIATFTIIAISSYLIAQVTSIGKNENGSNKL